MARFGQEKNWTVYADGIGGTGFISPGPCGGQSFASRLDRAIQRHPSVLIVEGGLNDVDTDPAMLSRAVRELLQRAAQVPRVIVVGPTAAPARPKSAVVDGLLRSTTQEADRVYVSTQRWRLPFRDDGVHPSVAGYYDYADMLSAVVKS